MITAIQRAVATDDPPAGSPALGIDEVRQVLDVVAQSLSVIAPLAARLRHKLHQDEDVIALEVAVRRAVESVRTLQPVRPEVISPTGTVGVR